MKLSVGLLAALAGVNDAALSCDSGFQLFHATCNKDGFTITINEDCRQSDFSGIDFTNSFMFGRASQTQRVTATGTASASVADYVDNCSTDPTFGSMCADVCPGEPVAASVNIPAYGASTVVKDSWQWNIPFNNCAVQGQLHTATGPDQYWWYYDLYFNSFNDHADNLVQMGQVKFQCQLKDFQEDSGSVVITEDDMVADADFQLRLHDYLQLAVKSVRADDGAGTAVDTSATSITNIATSFSGASTSGALTYTDVSGPVYLGDHMALVVEEVGSPTVATPGDILNNYSISLEKCWASDTQHDATYTEQVGTAGGSFTQEIIYPDNQGSYATTHTTGKQFTLWEDHCPQQFWVSPHSSEVVGSSTSLGNYLNELWDRSTDIREIHFRQFGFHGFTSGTSTIYYHCLIRVCDTTGDGDCNTKKVDGTSAACTNPTSFAPSTGRRRRSDDASSSENDGSLTDLTASVEVTNNQGNSDESSGAAACAATGFALFGLMNL